MNTPAHLILGAATFAHEDQRGSLTAALGGALAPDLSLYLMAGWHLAVIGTPADVVFRDLYYSEAWQAIFAVDNSVFVWGSLLALGIFGGWAWLRVFAAAALLHVALDFPLHAGDGRPHFWPLTQWVFDSPVSYWDERYFGSILGPMELLLTVALSVVLIRRFRTMPPRLLFAGLLAFEAASSGIWYLMF
ncbi:MAG: cobalamin biosynthesis protein CobQ [Pseudomonadota bacterium]